MSPPAGDAPDFGVLRDLAQCALEPGSASGVRVLQQRWLKAFRSVRNFENGVREWAAKGREIPPETQPLIENLPRLRAKFRETRETLRSESLQKLPLVRNGKQEMTLRAYVLARRFLERVHFAFLEPPLVACLEVFQARQTLNINEIWALKPILQLVLLEEAGAAAEIFRQVMKKKDPIPEGLSGETGKLALSLLELEYTEWGGFFEKVSHVEEVLRTDPSGVYPRMDPESRDVYRQAIVDLAAHSDSSEIEVTEAAIDLGRQAREIPHENPRNFERRKHAGYYVADEGRRVLEERIHYRVPFHKRIERAILYWPEIYYVIGIEVVTIGLIAFLLSGLRAALPLFGAIALLLLPATESAVRIVNQLTSFLIRPRRLPKLDFSAGIPAEYTSMVVVPNLLLSERQVREAVEALEIRYLANSSANLHFALLTDSPDTTKPLEEKNELVDLCVKLIEDLNRRYISEGKGSFFLFHRHRVYNPVEGAWMGWERKRGKLLDLNNLLRNNFDSFPVKAGDLSILSRVRYVITLDADTQLPRDTAQQLVGTLAHPLNRAIIDPETNTVVSGYGILQPRVGISVQSVTRSHLASIYSGQTGFDLYTRAISDVYQDLFGEGSFTGKGIYEVDVYQQVLAQRFPANALLSHDLIEGSYARAGLVSDVEVVDDYPSHFSAYSRRKHRWVRGDWQILRWLLNRVPGYSGESVPNPLSFIARWKILDNLRRSLIEAATLALLLGGWFFLPGGALYWTVATLVLLLAPSYLQLLLSLAMVGNFENWRGYLKESVKGFVIDQVNVLLTLVFLLHQSLVTMDAIVRTLIRVMVTHKRLLEWETAAQSELKSQKKTPVEICLDLTLWFSILMGIAVVYLRPAALPEALPFLVVWACSKPICRWLDLPLPSAHNKIHPKDEAFLREVALRTWRFLNEWSNAGTNWLIPDYVQESPQLVAKVISPTNLGLLLNARLAAYDLGYLTIREFAHLTENTLNTARKLPSFKGHFFNWSHIETLGALEPLFVSTVDSGNLAACLWTLKQGCLEMIRSPLFQGSLWQGLRDHLILLAEEAARQPESKERTALLKSLKRRLESLGDDPIAWLAALPDLEQEARELGSKLSAARGSQPQEAVQYWAAGLSARLANLRKMAEDFAPWLLPEFGSLLRHPALQPQIPLDRLIPEVLPQTLAELEGKLRRLAEDPDTDVEVRSNAQLLLARVRTSLRKSRDLSGTLWQLANKAESLVSGMDFRFLYNPARKLLSIGYNVKAQKLEAACYDFLASEARTASFIAIAKGDIPQQSWLRLARSHTLYHGERTLLSWSGTLFEYLMPALWMEAYPDTILAMSQQTAIRCQQKFARRKHRPWGVTEAAFSRKDANGNYQYQAFGIPSLALKADISAQAVAPYAPILALPMDPHGAVANLRRMKRMGWLGEFGYYESADYKPDAHHAKAKYELVRSWMAHHQGMSLLAFSNFLADSAIQKRFHAEPRVQATERILHERVPATVPVVPMEGPVIADAQTQPAMP